MGKMKTQLVLVEREDKTQNTIIGCSGLMLNDIYVITTANVLSDQTGIISEKLESGKLYTNFPKHDVRLNIVWKENELYVVKKAAIFATFISGNIKDSNKHIFKSWAVDIIDNNRDINEVISLFFVLAVGQLASEENFKSTLREWWDLTIKEDVTKGTSICVRSVPFANRNFIDSFSNGIVSNIFGNSSCLILSDCPSTPGSEGSPVYLRDDGRHVDQNIPIGLVVASVSWWRGEWVGLTLIADIKAIILELGCGRAKILNVVPKIVHHKIIAPLECCLAQIYNGKNWGTAILLCEEKGIFITNSHVVGNTKLSLFHRGQFCEATLIYRTPDNAVFDLAIVKADPFIVKNSLHLKSISVSKKKYARGDTVYSAGYSIFPKECDPSPTLSKGCISQIHPYMIKTTCCVHPGCSGGAILDEEGALVGIIVCNARLENNNVVYPRINMAIPFSAISETVFSFIQREIPMILNDLHVKDKEAEFIWKRIEGKL